MKFEKVVFVRYFPLTNAIYRDFYFEELIQNNIEVEYLDVTGLFDFKVSDSFDFKGIVKISSYKQLDFYLKNNSGSNILYISIMTFEWRVFRLFRLFTNYHVKFGVFARGVFPSIIYKDKKSKIAWIVNTMSFSKVADYCFNKITSYAKKYTYIKSYDYIFKAGEFGYNGLGIGSEIDLENSKIIEINTVDYDQFVLHKELPYLHDEEYIVFLDQYLPYHPDATFFKIKTVGSEQYFYEVNIFFDRIELATGKNVIIAAHPKAMRYREFNPFNNRTIFFNQSNDLVKNAFLVLTHASTAICFPICYQKKIILLVSDYLDKVLPQFSMTAQSIKKACGATIIAMDNENDFKIPEKINPIKYKDFKYKYLTSIESENMLSKDIFINFIKK